MATMTKISHSTAAVVVWVLLVSYFCSIGTTAYTPTSSSSNKKPNKCHHHKDDTTTISSATTTTTTTTKNSIIDTNHVNRRSYLSKTTAATMIMSSSFLSSSSSASFSVLTWLQLLFQSPERSYAFENRLDDQYLDRTPQIGLQPDNLGVTVRTSKTLGKDYIGLAPCDGRPNCWCSSTPFQDNPARYIEPWGGESSGKNTQNSIRDIKHVIDTYEVGQQGIDGGGFKVIEYNDGTKGDQQQYLYVQFQSYKYGYIDDVEFWYNPEKKKFDVRSASRLGQSDLGVNGKRLEYIGSRLEKEFGWTLKRRKNGSLV